VNIHVSGVENSAEDDAWGFGSLSDSKRKRKPRAKGKKDPVAIVEE
jgi:hypothetical protein